MLVTLILLGCFVSDAELEAALDRDNDGFQPDVAGGPDCDGENAAVSPDAPELCGDGIDNDCDGAIDDRGIGERPWFPDADDDGWGDGDPIMACSPPEDHVELTGDCDDTDPEVNPNALDLCDDADQDCDGLVDDDATFRLLFRDADGDGYGVDTDTLEACGSPQDYAPAAGDCDDADASIQPGIDDFCDGVDQDCDGAVDEDASFTTWFQDADGDGVGATGSTASVCGDPPSGFVDTAGDCDDADPAVILPSWFLDGDSDGHGAGAPVQACVAPANHVASDDDCDDAEPLRSPSLPEVCENGLDDDCSSATDCRPTGTQFSTEPAVAVLSGEPVDDVELEPVGDFMGSAAPDLVVRTSTGLIIVDGADVAAFAALATVPGNVSIAASPRDLDGDGWPELLIRDDTTQQIDIYLGNQPAIAGAPLLVSQSIAVIGAGPSRAAAADWPGLGSGTWVSSTPGIGEDGELRFLPWQAGLVSAQDDATLVIPGRPAERLGKELRTVRIDNEDHLQVNAEDRIFLCSGAELQTSANAGSLTCTHELVLPAQGVLAFTDLSPLGMPDSLIRLTVDFEALLFETAHWPDGSLLSMPELHYGPPGTFSILAPIGDADSDGALDLGTNDDQGLVLSIVYGATDDHGSTTAGFSFRPDASNPVWHIEQFVGSDFDQDGYGDVVVLAEPSDAIGSSGILVLRGTGQ